MENRRIHDYLRENGKFAPEINERSRKLTRRRHRGEDIFNSLYKRAKTTEKKKRKIAKEELSKLFNPVISARSREIIGDIQAEELIKYDNGRTENLDFYEALPLNAGEATLKKSPNFNRMNKGKPGCIEGKKYHDITCEKFNKKKKLIPGEKKNLNPEYLSPYSKEILAKEKIPLKTIVKDVKDYNRRNKEKSRNKVLKRSLSHSKSKANLLEDIPLLKGKSNKDKFRKKNKNKKSYADTVKKILDLDQELYEKQKELNETNKKRRTKKLVYMDDLDATDRSLFVKRRPLRFDNRERGGSKDYEDFEATDVSVHKFKV